MIRVDEPNDAGQLGSVASPNQPTYYAYDTLNNLTTVTQGLQTRTFTYNSLSRLLTAANPESGTIQYGYDANGNLTTKTDARGITTTYAYDALNRVTQRNYSDSTPAVSYFYDNLTNAKGRLTKVTSSVSTTEYTSFDILGRVTGHKQTTDGQEYATGYVYNLSGAMVEQVYPSGRVVKNVLDANGDLSMVQSKKNAAAGFWNYAENFTYNAAGAVTSMQLGNGRWESTQFNSRLQPTQIALGVTQGATNLLDLDYTYGTTQNNGNVLSQTITIPRTGQSPFALNQTFSYDSLNRIKTAEEKPDGYTQSQCDQNPTHCWKQTFLFDRYGNRNFDTANGATTTLPANFDPNIYNPTVSTSNNRFSTGQGWAYDAAGNVITDAEGRSFTYDAENKQVGVKGSNQQTIGTYDFDGDGKRVKKVVPATGETTIFVYDASGKLVAEYSTVIESFENAKVAYLTADHLGSPRINTDANGVVTARHDYHPFGEEIATSHRTAGLGYDDDSVRQQFTGYERDHETGLDFAQARMLGSSFGRFTSPDDFLNATRQGNPATWNLYVYVLNNPLRYIDPTGQLEKDADGNIVFHEKKKKKYKSTEKVLDSEGNEVKINGKNVYRKVSYTMTEGYVMADDGKTKITAYKAASGVKVELVGENGKALKFDSKDIAANEKLSSIQNAYDNAGYDATADCHGVTFASGQVWINNDQVGKIIKGDGYRQVTGDEGVQAADVIIYSTDGTLGKSAVEHSVTVNSILPLTVTSKGGYTRLQPNAAVGPGPGTAWNNPSSKITVWTKRAKPGE